MARAFEALPDDTAVRLAPIRQVPELATEAKMLDALEQMKLRVQLREYLNANMGGIDTRASHAAMQGVGIPAHLCYEGQLCYATSVFEKGEPFLRAAERLIRQVLGQQEFLMMTRPHAEPLSCGPGARWHYQRAGTALRHSIMTILSERSGPSP
jgi:hypothetical protein